MQIRKWCGGRDLKQLFSILNVITTNQIVLVPDSLFGLVSLVELAQSENGAAKEQPKQAIPPIQ
jgi:hypothetical protein